MRSLAFALLLFSVFTFCKGGKQTPVQSGIVKATGTLRALNLDGCRWVIELDNEQKEKLEPMNFHQLKFTPKDGKAVSFSYELSKSMSTCMAGIPVNIKRIKYRK